MKTKLLSFLVTFLCVSQSFGFHKEAEFLVFNANKVKALIQEQAPELISRYVLEDVFISLEDVFISLEDVFISLEDGQVAREHEFYRIDLPNGGCNQLIDTKNTYTVKANESRAPRYSKCKVKVDFDKLWVFLQENSLTKDKSASEDDFEHAWFGALNELDYQGYYLGAEIKSFAIKPQLLLNYLLNAEPVN